jgi:hypothetical protein
MFDGPNALEIYRSRVEDTPDLANEKIVVVGALKL